MSKKRVLLCGESSYLSTGFATYGLEVMKRLHASGKYELAELGAYGDPADGRGRDLPWAFYPAQPHPDDRDGWNEYSSKVTNQFGEWKFDEVCCDFRPDVCWSFRDIWMDEFICRSPFRPYFRFAWMPTVDAAPQAPEWVANLLSADAVFSYSDWGLGVLRGQGVPAITSAPPGADYDVLRPAEDRRAHKRDMSLPEDVLVVGTVMRNQKRKLYDDLIKSFAAFLREAPRELARRAYLYLHCYYPDVGWDIPRLVLEHGVGSRTLFTYMCTACGVAFPSFYMDARAYCRSCKANAATLPGSAAGVPRSVLAKVLNFFDVYVQYANCLKPGTEVLLRRGWSAIESVQVGDEAYTHTGSWRPVVRTFRHERGDRPFDLRLWGDYETMTVTSEHPLYGIRAADVKLIRGHSLRETLGHRIRNRQPVPAPSFSPAGSYSTGDLVAYRIDDSVEDVSQIDLADYADERDAVGQDKVRVKWGGCYDRFVAVTKEFCRFLGLYAADGNSNISKGHKAVTVTCHQDEADNISLSSSVLAQMTGRSARIVPYRGRMAVDVQSYSKPHALLLRELCGVGIGKKLPDWTVRLPTEKQQEILVGLFMGDGHFSYAANVSIYVTTSPTLARQVKELLRRCRLGFNVRLVHKGGRRKPQYRFEVRGDLASGKPGLGRTNTGGLYLGPWHLMKVKSVSPSDYAGEVLNFEVAEDNSYLTRTCIVHNSEGFGLPQVEAAACGVPVMSVDYSAMSDVVRKLRGCPLKVLALSREPETGCYRAVPDNADLVRNLIDFLSLPEQARLARGGQARHAAMAHYSYDRTAKVWMDWFDGVECLSRGVTWGSPARTHVPPPAVPKGLSDAEFVRWGIEHVAGRPDLADGHLALRMTRDLNWGATVGNVPRSVFTEHSLLGVKYQPQPYDREAAAAEFMAMCRHRNYWETRRAEGASR